eukprot:3510300-Heterocapsa_arctica.AAC.1
MRLRLEVAVLAEEPEIEPAELVDTALSSLEEVDVTSLDLWRADDVVAVVVLVRPYWLAEEFAEVMELLVPFLLPEPF